MRLIILIMIGFSLLQAKYIRVDSKEVVLDTRTDLIWQDDSDAITIRKNWRDALSYCKAKSLGGYSDWRLPNINELHISADQGSYNPVFWSVFKNLNGYDYWSSITRTNNSSNAFTVNFSEGDVAYRRKTHRANVRCVR